MATEKGIFPVAHSTSSYWRSEPHELEHFRSTDRLPEACDIAIIGAGLSGVMAAYNLTKDSHSSGQKPSVVLLEARQVCSGATGRNGGHIKLQVSSMAGFLRRYDWALAMKLFSFVTQQISAFKDIVQREQIDCEFELRRSFDVWLEQREADDIARFWQECIKAGHTWTADYQFYGRDSAERVTSMKGAKAAFSMPACSMWPYKFVTQLLARLLQKNLINLQTHTTVETLSQILDGTANIIVTNRGIITAKKVILATNAYTAGLLPRYRDIIVPYLGTATHLMPTMPISPHLTNTYNINYDPGSRRDYMNPRPGGGIVIGGGKWTFQQDKQKWFNVWDDSQVMEEVNPHFESIMQHHFLGWESSGARPSHIWTGIMGATADAMPHVGQVPGSSGTQYILAGYNGGGMSMIPQCAEAVARMVLDDAPFEETKLPLVFKPTAARLTEFLKDPGDA